jgi:hypothetical protein
MITEQLLNLFLNLLSGMLNVLPVLQNSRINEMSAGIAYLFVFIKQANTFIPIDTFFIVVGLMIGIKNFKMVFFIINWIIRRIADIIP